MAFLIVNRGTDTARERLIDVFWPDVDPDRARDSLSTALHSIRRSLRTAGIDASAFLLTTKSIVRWRTDAEVDSEEFARLAARDDPLAIQEALELYKGDFLEGDYEEWVAAERERLATLYESVLVRAVRTSNDTEAARRLIARSTYDEQAYAAIIDEELRAGRRSLAASWVERCRTDLSEVGVEPSATFEARFGSIVHVEPRGIDELRLPFVGRRAELALLAERFSNVTRSSGSFTILRGEAGIGKSTLLNRAARVATEYGLNVLVANCSGEVSGTFEPWRELFDVVGDGESFDTFARAHPGDVVTAVAKSIAARLTKPTALFVDDVHELKGEALDIFVALSRTIASQHAIIAGTRPEGAYSMLARLGDLPLEELSIDHLEQSDLRWALVQTLGGEQPQVFETLYDRAGGHPLFFTGLLNSLVSAGTLTRNGHHWLLAKAIDASIELPDTMRRFIEGRLRERGDAARAVACALALEPSANSDDLAAALLLDDSVTWDALDDLLALGLITHTSSGPPFAFTHHLVQDVAALGLNAGRRAFLHRFFARRLQANGRVDSSLRLARHLEAAGEPLSAARSYLKSAQEALELNAAQDAVDRCDAGVALAEQLERTASHNVLLAMLHATAGRAAIAMGDVGDAMARARRAVTLADAGDDAHEATRAALDLIAIEGMAARLSEQKSDAIAAADKARLCGDNAQQVEGLLHQANAARNMGLREEALAAGQEAYTLALRCDRFDLAAIALAESLRVQVAWWMFGDALKTAGAGLDVARRADPLAEAAFLQARCALWYLLERFAQAESELQNTIRIADESVARGQQFVGRPIHPQPFLKFACHYLVAKIAVAQEQWNRALEAADKAHALSTVEKLPRYHEALALVRIDAFLRRNLPGDSESASALMADLAMSPLREETLEWSDCVELASARVCVQQRKPGTGVLLRRVIDTLEENAHQAPRDCDRAFARLAEAAFLAADKAVAQRARDRSTHYRLRRVALAGAAWGGAER